MAKRKGISYEEKLINALKKLPNPIEDTKHGLFLYFIDNRARSNESRFEHFFKASHMLLPRDIEHIPSGIKKAKLRKDKNRKRTFEYTFERKGNKKEFVKICIQIDKEDSRIAIVKTIFVSKNDK